MSGQVPYEVALAAKVVVAVVFEVPLTVTVTVAAGAQVEAEVVGSVQSAPPMLNTGD